VKSPFSYRSLGLLVAVLGLATSVAPGAAAGAAKPVTHTVNIDGTAFVPPKMTVAAGDTIVWVNKDPYPHTATSSATVKNGGFDSKSIAGDKSWKFTAKKKGDYPYICSIHPTMTGTITVK
jgi:plastocyanin